MKVPIPVVKARIISESYNKGPLVGVTANYQGQEFVAKLVKSCNTSITVRVTSHQTEFCQFPLGQVIRIPTTICKKELTKEQLWEQTRIEFAKRDAEEKAQYEAAALAAKSTGTKL